MKYIMIAAFILIPAIIVIAIHLLIQIWKGKNQTITNYKDQIDELKDIRTGLADAVKLLQDQLSEEELRTKAITELYDEKCEQYDELYAITVTNIFKPKGKKLLTLEVMEKAAKQSLKVVNA